MMKREFEIRINAEISAQEWETIERVYTWHPSIPDVGGKDIIAQLYSIGGFAVIRDMDITATMYQDVYEQRRAYMQEIAKKREEIAREIKSLNAKIAELNAADAQLCAERDTIKAEISAMMG